MDQYNNYIGLTLDGRYKIKRHVGIGGMAMVFEADDLFRKTVVAVKILKDEFATDEVSVQRFINESKAVLMLSHANIVKIFDVSVKGEHKYIVMEYIDGITLKTYMEKKGALSVKETISYTTQILRALEHAHLGGIVHRDIKPQNIMLLPNGQIKVTDFGIAKLPDAKTLTATDKAIGTVYYISPEQAAGEKGIDRRTDLYSVGVVMYEMLTGKLPFDGENPVSIALKQINEQPKPPSEIVSTIPKGLEQIIMFAMEKDKDKRFQTATQMIDLLHKVKENPMVIFRQRTSGAAAKKKKNTITPIILGVASAFLLVFGISFGLFVYDLLFGGDDNVDKSRIDSYVGYLYEDVEAELEDLFVVNKVTIDSSADETGVIIRQVPAAGEKRKSGEITVYIGAGPKQITVPDYSYKSRMTAETDLRNKGLKCDYMYQPSSTVASGHVISTLPTEGEQVTAGTTVTLILSSGDDLSKSDVVDMPLLVGLDTTEAYSAMVKYGLRFSDATYVYSDEYEEGKVIAQSPIEGTSVPKDITKVSLTISMGKPPKTTSTVPLVDGRNLEEAIALLEGEGLKVGSYTEMYSDSVAQGIIFGQAPAANRTVPIGSSVTFTVSKGPEPYIPPVTEAPVTEPPVITEPIVTEADTTEATAATSKDSGPSGRFG